MAERMSGNTDAERVRTQLQRILASSAFRDSERASRFLRFVVEAKLEGRGAEVKESVIGIEALGRNASFDPKTDPIVRVEAGRLRTRLNGYYENEGRTDPIRIALPKGGYIPEFSPNQLARTALRDWQLAAVLVLGALIGLAVSTAFFFFHFRKSSGPADTLRVSILPPRGAVIEQFAISPDGKRIAFTAITGGKLQLWIRSLDSLEAALLPGTDDAADPFWSPDGRSLGFFARTTLKRIEISGGPPRSLCQTGPFRGGSWGSSGALVYAPHPVDVLYQIPESGGTPKPVTTLDRARGEIAHGFPQFLPDGRHFLYFAISSRPGESSVRVGSLDSSDSKFLVNAEASGIYAPRPGTKRGYLLFVYGGALLAQAFEPAKLEVSGERKVVVPKIAYSNGRADFSASETGVLAYRSGGFANRQLAWFDREGRLLETVGPLNDYYGWSLSPDKKRIAAMVNDPTSGLPSIWIFDVTTGGTSRFTFGAGPAFTPVWSADGSDVLFTTGTEQVMSIQRQSLTAQAAVRLLESVGPKFLTDWSANGRLAAFFTPWPEWNKLNLFIADLTRPAGNDNPQRLWPSDYSEYAGEFSPTRGVDGIPRWFAYVSNETGQDEIYVRNFPVGDHKWLVSSAGGWQPHWSNDGKELFYLTLDGTLMAVEIKGTNTFYSGPPHTLFHTRIPPWGGPPGIPTNSYAVSKNGRRFLINSTASQTTAAQITLATNWQAGLR